MRCLLLLLLPILAFAQEFEFQQEWDSIGVEIEEFQLPVPWTGGYSYSHPALCDLDSDGDPDLFLGQVQGIISYFENQGTATIPSFSLIEEIWQGMDVGGHSGPSFQDLDADGDFDLVLESGNLQTSIWLNVGTPSIPLFELYIDTLKDEFGTPIDGTYGDFIDIDADGDLDFFTGAWYTGTVSYYENIGDTSSVVLSLVTSNLLGTNLNDFIKLKFCDIDDDSDYDLFIGDRYGHIQYFPNEGNPVIYNFGNQVVNWQGIDVGDYAAPEFCDIDGDGDYDLFVGRDAYNDISSPGDVFFYENIGDSLTPDFQHIASNYLTIDVGSVNMPKIIDFDFDGDLDLLYSSQNKLGYFENIGNSSNPYYSFVTNDLSEGIPPYFFDLYDLDSDGDLDLVAANGAIGSGEITFYQNRGTASSPDFIYSFSIYTSYVLGSANLVDIDGDNDADLIQSWWGGGFAFYENQGTQWQPNFVFITDDYCDLPSGRSARFVDIEGDGDLDLFAGYNALGLVELYLNTGNPQIPVFELWDSDVCEIGEMAGPKPGSGDIDNDGDADLFIGIQNGGGLLFFRNVTGQNEVGPKRPIGPPLPQLDFSIGPNPANPVTWISFSLPAPQEATVAVYNILGAKVTTLTSGLQMPGTHNVIWNASQVSSGLYIIRLETPTQSLAKTLTILR